MIAPADVFAENCKVWSDIVDHLPLLYNAAIGNVLEIGVRGGASTSALLAGVENHGGHLWSVDVNNCKIFDHPQWTFMQANSVTEKERILAEISKELEVLFVDGDHTYEGCLSDLQTFGPMAKTIFVHDCECPDTFPGVRKAFEEFGSYWGLSHFVISGSYGMGVIQMPRTQKAKQIAGWMTEPELIWLARQANQKHSIVEVGAYQGQTTRVLGDNTAGRVYAVDDWKGLREDWWETQTPKTVKDNLFDLFSDNLSDLIDTGKVAPLIADHANIQKMTRIPTGDMIFIDGDHRYESVKRDIESWLPFLEPGGILCGHDFNQEPVRRAVFELLPEAKDAVGLIWQWEKK